MSAILVLDAGNSRMKWGLAASTGWIITGATPNAEIGTLSLREWQNLPRPLRAVGVNVAGEAARVRVEAQLARWRIVPEWILATPEAGGVRNPYAKPERLGADRWAALVAVRQRLLRIDAGPPPAVVVDVGTAVTVDALDREGAFLGGLILPGIDLMLGALAANTNALSVPRGAFKAYPTSTSDALYTGAVQAICGAIELVRAKLLPGGATRCYLTGGGAREIADHLTAPVEVVDNLVLDGVLELASAR